MRIIVDKLPKTSEECLFSWKHVEYSKRICRFGGVCKVEDGNTECKYLLAIKVREGDADAQI